MQLYNTLSAEERRKLIKEAGEDRLTLSFYQYAHLSSPKELRDELFLKWEKLEVLGRTYIATEGINAQISVPTHSFKTFKEELYKKVCFQDVPFKFAVEEKTFSFYKLTIKVKKQIVADG